ncbi:type II toxin-antitoxin system HipA family toxin [Sphingobacterium sp. JB170]|uniref:type II toxin-antitoxin system HipA family toxin n=1 Tax=Sphingobacterium sp. JB170 TaxID=1434842 RepID=UPI00097E89A1|nr:type II toxin-antitoxin system HipA family toxin [Sphingobacterium sp. JB170]SJN20053.1 HIPA PROTEIN [Sphingobacterium sp. JB170]
MIQHVKEVIVSLDFGNQVQQVGRLAIRENTIYFQYDEAFVESGIDISPLRLPLQAGLIVLPKRPFEGLAGVFNDSLPDGWGRLLFDRLLTAHAVQPKSISPLDRLTHVGREGMGALIYEPDRSTPTTATGQISLDQLAQDAMEIISGGSEEVLKELFMLNGSSAGARPKVLIAVNKEKKDLIYGTNEFNEDFEPWLIKFPNTQDGSDAGALEYVYALMAKLAGVEMPEVHLFASGNGPGFFGVKRFDRDGNKRKHMHTASGILHSDFRSPTLDYLDLTELTMALTKDVQEVEKIYRLAVFNVLAHNRDDHAKNFSFLMDSSGQWTLSPAYDLTFSSGPGGEQSTMVAGEGKSPQTKDLIKLGENSGIRRSEVRHIIVQTKSALERWQELATTYGVSKAQISAVKAKICK